MLESITKISKALYLPILEFWLSIVRYPRQPRLAVVVVTVLNVVCVVLSAQLWSP